MSRIGSTPFIPGEITSHPGVRYCTGWNCSGTGQHEILQVTRHPDGTEDTHVIMRGMSQAKAAAIVMILNAPEPS